MILYHTIRLTSIDADRTAVLDIETMKSEGRREGVFSVLDSFNKKGYVLTAVNKHDYYLTKRVD